MQILGWEGLGVVFQDSTNTIAALSQKIAKPQTVMAEALAANRAKVLAKKLSIFKVVVKGDCLQVIQALNAPGRCHTMYGHVIEDIWLL